MIGKINFYLDRLFGIEIIGSRPKEAIRFAKKYFNGKKISAVEIGVLRGQNSEDILKSLNVGKIYLIDPYSKYSDYESDGNYNNLISAEKEARRKLKKYSGSTIWINEYSDKAVSVISNKVDFIYIDGNHEYEYVKKDLELYWEKLKNGGIFSGHDIQHFGVSRALMEFAQKKNIPVHFGDRRDWWIIKNESSA